MHTTMLTLLAKEAMKGNKPSNTFKAGSIWGRVLPLVCGESAAYVEDHVEYNSNSLEEEWISMG